MPRRWPSSAWAASFRAGPTIRPNSGSLSPAVAIPRARRRRAAGGTDAGASPRFLAADGTPAALGGYITDFDYDWRSHKVPPKQVQQADPLAVHALGSGRPGPERRRLRQEGIRSHARRRAGRHRVRRRFFVAIGAWPAIAAHGIDSQAVVCPSRRRAGRVGRDHGAIRRRAAEALAGPGRRKRQLQHQHAGFAHHQDHEPDGRRRGHRFQRHFGRRRAGHERRFSGLGRLRHDDLRRRSAADEPAAVRSVGPGGRTGKRRFASCSV